jgi:hypothetical protein
MCCRNPPSATFVTSSPKSVGISRRN